MNRVALLLMMFFLFLTDGLSQFRLDADFRLGRSNVKYILNEEGGAYGEQYMALDYKAAVSWGVDANLGYEFKFGAGVYSGLAYDRIRTYARNYTMFHPITYEMQDVWHNHLFDFLSVPLKVEYRLLKGVVRPYVGYEAAFLVHRDSYTEWRYEDLIKGRGDDAHFEYRVVTPVFVFGLNLEYKRFVVGVDFRRDQKPFCEEKTNYMASYKSHQTSFRVGWRVF